MDCWLFCSWNTEWFGIGYTYLVGTIRKASHQIYQRILKTMQIQLLQLSATHRQLYSNTTTNPLHPYMGE